MAIKYRQNRDEKVDLKRTQSSTSDDPILNKAKQISRKNDDVKNRKDEKEFKKQLYNSLYC